MDKYRQIAIDKLYEIVNIIDWGIINNVEDDKKCSKIGLDVLSKSCISSFTFEFRVESQS